MQCERESMPPAVVLNRRRYLQAKASNKGEVVLESARLQCGGRPWYALNYYNKLYLTWFNLIGLYVACSNGGVRVLVPLYSFYLHRIDHTHMFPSPLITTKLTNYI